MLTINLSTVQQYLGYLYRFGVNEINIRVFDNHISSRIFSTKEENFSEISNFIIGNKFEQANIHCTFNRFNNLEPKATAVKDSDVLAHTFLFIDIDPIRPSGLSATNQEKSSAESLLNEVSEWLKKYDVTGLKIDSGNGYHMLIPLEFHDDIKKITDLKKRLLVLLSKKFNTETSEVDKTVFNPSRLGKLVGCVASKGEPTEERPHRISSLLSNPNEITERVSIAALEKMIIALSSEFEVEGKVIKSFDRRQANSSSSVKEWLDSYPEELGHQVKPGDKDGVLLYIFDSCPLKKHSNNSNGASLIEHPDGSLQFKCLHASHQDVGLKEFEKLYPRVQSISSVEVPKIELSDLQEGKTYRFDRYILNEKGLRLQRDKDSIRICSCLFIKTVMTHIETREIRIELCYLDSEQKWQSIMLEGQMLQQYQLKQLAKYGIELSSRYDAELADFLMIQKRGANHLNEFNHIGWNKEDEAAVYYLDTDYRGKTKEKRNKSVLSSKSLYQFESVGCLATFRDMYNNEVKETPGELAIALGVAPIVLGYLKTFENLDLQNCLFNFNGRSSSGKTTMQILIGSLYGSPDVLVRSLNSTQNALVKLLTDNTGVPVILDELGTNTTLDLSALVYQIAAGSERLRLNQSSEFIEPKYFKTIPVFSSENSLSVYLDNNEGLLTRYIECTDIKWTKSAKSAESIKSVCRNNYGVFIKEFLNRLMEDQLPSIRVLFNQQKEELLVKMLDHRLKERTSNNLALIMTSAKIVNNLMEGFSLDMESLQELLISSNEQTLTEASEKKNDFAKISEFIIQNRARFILGSQSKTSYGEVWGKYRKSPEGVIVNIFKEKFETIICQLFSVKEARPIIVELREADEIKTEKGRNTKRIRLNSESMVTYEIHLPKDAKFYFSDSEETTSYTSKLSVNQKDNSINSFFSEDKITENDLKF